MRSRRRLQEYVRAAGADHACALALGTARGARARIVSCVTITPRTSMSQHELLDLAQAQPEPVIQPHAMRDDLRRIPVTLVRHLAHDGPSGCVSTPRSSASTAPLTNLTVPRRARARHGHNSPEVSLIYGSTRRPVILLGWRAGVLLVEGPREVQITAAACSSGKVACPALAEARFCPWRR
jgi:hypothetical protein